MAGMQSEDTPLKKKVDAFHGLAGWYAVHVVIALIAACVALATSFWIDTNPSGLLGIDNAGLWTVCYTKVPANETVKDLTDHLEKIVTANLFGEDTSAKSLDSDERKKLEKEVMALSSTFNQTIRERLQERMDGLNFTTDDSVPPQDQETINAAEGSIPLDEIEEDLRNSIMYSDVLKEISVTLLVNQSLVNFPLASGCSNPLYIYSEDKVGTFFSAVPFPSGPDAYYLLQCLRGFVVGFGLFGVIVSLFAIMQIGISVGSCSHATVTFLFIFTILQVIAGTAGVISYFILIARIASSDAKQVLNVSYLFVDDQITYGLSHYWGWSAWTFVGAACWSILGLPILYALFYKHSAVLHDDSEDYGLLPHGNGSREIEFVPSTVIDNSDDEDYSASQKP